MKKLYFNYLLNLYCFILYNLIISNAFRLEKSLDDDDVKRNVTELIESKGYKCLNYEITTPDGFILSLQRIPLGKSHSKIPDWKNPIEVAVVRQKDESPKDLFTFGKNVVERGVKEMALKWNKGTHARKSGKYEEKREKMEYIENQKFMRVDKPVVYLQHGLLDSSSTWVMNPANESLGFVLADAGYDVWIGNSRGNTYSRKHVKYSPSDPLFWNWSYDEMANIDLQSTLEYITNVTGQKQIYYIGHSQGGLIGLAGLSENKYISQRIKCFIGLAPAAYVSEISGVAKYLLETIAVPEIIFKIFGIHEFLPNSEASDWLADNFCDKEIAREICKNILFLTSGFNNDQMNISRIPVYIAHTPAGTSVKNMVHYSQVFKSGKFQKFDYGSQELNILHYNQTTPPQYQLENIRTPVHIIAGAKDYLADPKDIQKLLSRLKSLETFREYPEWAHLDFVWGSKPHQLLGDVLSILTNC